MCRGIPPDLPWAAGLAKSAPRTTLMAVRVPPVEERREIKAPCFRRSGDEADDPSRSAGSPAAFASSLMSENPGRPAQGIRRSEGFASTAVGPFY